MKNLNVLLLALCLLLFQNCTLEQGLNVGHGLISTIDDEGVDSNYFSSQDELNALNKNWSNEQCNYFEVPMQYGDDVIFLGNGLRSVNIYTGAENWNVDIGFVSNAISPIIVDDNMYFIDSGEIFIVDLLNGALLLKQKWRSNEYVDRYFNIQDGIMYVSFREKNKAYSGFASCSLDEIDGGFWANFNGTGTVNNIYTSTKGSKVGKNLQGEHIIYYTSESSDHTVQNSIKSHKVQAYNVATNKIDWIYEDAPGQFVYEEVLLTQFNQVIVKGQFYILSLNAQTGQKKWEVPINSDFYDLTNSIGLIEHNDILINIKGQEIATAYNISSGQKLWELNNPSNYVSSEIELSKNSVNFIGDTMFYLSSVGYLMEVDLSVGTYIKHHELLEFSGGLIVDEDENFIAFPKYEPRSLLSFSL